MRPRHAHLDRSTVRTTSVYRWCRVSASLGSCALCASLVLVSPAESKAVAQHATTGAKLVAVARHPAGLRARFVSDLNGWVYSPAALWRTRDGGATWSSVVPSMPPTLLSVHFESIDVGWISIENNQSFPASPDELSIYSTSDGGKEWHRQPPPPLSAKGQQSAQFYMRGGLVGWEGGTQPTGRAASTGLPKCRPWWDGRQVAPVIYHTEDGGKHWSAQLLPAGCTVENISFGEAQRGVAVAGHNVYYTANGGSTWQESEFLRCCTDTDWFSVFSMPVTSVFLRGTTGWLSYADGYLFKTSDNGRSWRQLAHPGQIWHKQAGNIVASGTVYLTTDEHGVILGGDGSVYETIDGGGHWSMLESPEQIVDISCSDGGACWALSENELYRFQFDSRARVE